MTFKVGDFAFDKVSDHELVRIDKRLSGGMYEVHRADGFWAVRSEESLQELTPEQRSQVIENPTEEQQLEHEREQMAAVKEMLSRAGIRVRKERESV
jgi:hypothetical protein